MFGLTYQSLPTPEDITYDEWNLLLLVESEPQCSSSVHGVAVVGDMAVFTCQVEYSGIIPLKMKWTRASDPDSIIPPDVDESVAGNLTKIELHIKLDMNDKGEQYLCDTFFEPFTPLNDADATNKIAYEHQCKTGLLDVRGKWSLGGVSGLLAG